MKEIDEQRREQRERWEPVKAKTYVVKAGDSLSKIAKEVYGDAARWTEIYEANRATIKDPNVIEVGQELQIP